jgi:hypothetical protein
VVSPSLRKLCVSMVSGFSLLSLLPLSIFSIFSSIYLSLSIYLSIYLSLSEFLGSPYTGGLESLESVQGPEGLEPYSCWLSLVFTHALMCYLFVCFTAQGRKVKRW